MKQNYVFRLFLCSVLILALNSCGLNEMTYSIDNPTDEAIEVSIDGKTPIVLAPKEYMHEIGSMSKGKHTMKVGEGEVIKFVADTGYSIMLNPTLATYVYVSEIYGHAPKTAVKDTTFLIDGKKYTGTFSQLVSDPVLCFYGIAYNVVTDFPDEVETTSKSGYVRKNKMFRKDEFKTYYKKEYR